MQAARQKSLYSIINGSVTIIIRDNRNGEMTAGCLNNVDFSDEMGVFKQIINCPSAQTKAKFAFKTTEINYSESCKLSEMHPQ